MTRAPTMLRNVLWTYGAPAMVAVGLHGAVAVGVWSVGPGDVRPPRVLNSFEVVELPASAAQEEVPDIQPEPQSEPEPAPQPAVEQEVQPEPDPSDAPEPGPILTKQAVQKSQPAPPPPPKPKLELKPKLKPEPQATPKPVALKKRPALVQPEAAPAPALAYVAPSQHAAYLDNPKPAYPTMARKRGMEGRVVLRVMVRRDGTVKSIEVQGSTGYAILDRAARAAVTMWRFAPATRGGVPVEGEVLVPFDFRLTAG